MSGSSLSLEVLLGSCAWEQPVLEANHVDHTVPISNFSFAAFNWDCNIIVCGTAALFFVSSDSKCFFFSCFHVCTTGFVDRPCAHVSVVWHFSTLLCNLKSTGVGLGEYRGFFYFVQRKQCTCLVFCRLLVICTSQNYCSGDERHCIVVENPLAVAEVLGCTAVGVARLKSQEVPKYLHRIFWCLDIKIYIIGTSQNDAENCSAF